MLLLNLTPHPIYISSLDKKIESEMIPARLEEFRARGEELTIEDQTLRCNRLTYARDSAQGLPPQREGIYLIVSSIIALTFPDRRDLLVPDGPIKDHRGKIIGCRTLASVSYLSPSCTQNNAPCEEVEQNIIIDLGDPEKIRADLERALAKSMMQTFPPFFVHGFP